MISDPFSLHVHCHTSTRSSSVISVIMVTQSSSIAQSNCCSCLLLVGYYSLLLSAPLCPALLLWLQAMHGRLRGAGASGRLRRVARPWTTITFSGATLCFATVATARMSLWPRRSAARRASATACTAWTTVGPLTTALAVAYVYAFTSYICADRRF
jgi:hypothetical protein